MVAERDVMIKKIQGTKNPYRIVTIVLLFIGACFLTYYFHNVLKSGKIFTHFFYIPIFLSSLWWKRKGLIVPVLLALLLLLSHGQYRMDIYIPADYLRALMFICVGYVIAVLSEKLEASERAVQASKEIYRTIFETTGTATMINEADTSIFLVNRQFVHLSGYAKEELEGEKKWTEFFSKEDLDKMIEYHHIRRIDPDAAPGSYEARFVDREGVVREVALNVAVIPGTKKSVLSISDISAIKEAESARAILQERLEEALTHVLSGFIPICANCKKIRDEKGQWSQVESYISDRSDAEFSHGICPECGKELYGEFYKGEKRNG